MTITKRLTALEQTKPKKAGSDAKVRLSKHLENISDRTPHLTSEEQQESHDWLANDWPRHLQRLRSNAG